MEVGDNIKFVDMYHSKTTDSVKESIKCNMNNTDGHNRILVATSAAGMGVNYKGVNNVINFGPSRCQNSLQDRKVNLMTYFPKNLTDTKNNIKCKM